MKHFLWLLVIPLIVYSQEEWGHHPPSDAEFNAMSDEAAFHPGSLVVEKDLYARNLYSNGSLMSVSDTVRVIDTADWVSGETTLIVPLTWDLWRMGSVSVSGYFWPPDAYGLEDTKITLIQSADIITGTTEHVVVSYETNEILPYIADENDDFLVDEFGSYALAGP